MPASSRRSTSALLRALAQNGIDTLRGPRLLAHDAPVRAANDPKVSPGPDLDEPACGPARAWVSVRSHSAQAAPQAETAAGVAGDADDARLVPIRTLAQRHEAIIRAHLLALGTEDRFLRFGYRASDEQLARYVAAIDFERDELLGVFNRKLELIAFAHLALAQRDEAAKPLTREQATADALDMSAERCDACAEFGVTVLPQARGRGLGSHLFERAMLAARNAGVRMLFIHALSTNTPMLRIAEKFGAQLHREGDETEAYLLLPPGDLESRVEELVEERLAQIDFDLKRQSKRFFAFLRGLRTAREGLLERARDALDGS
jgi:GNAT superfamily N-acetyltransferase